jgi:ligand-binding sensor domain-containing protein
LQSAYDSDIDFENISLDEDLSQSVVITIIQDQRGFLWFGTQDGLNRYDGNKFKVYKHDRDDPASLSDSFVMVLHEDQTGTIWIGTNNGGLNSFDPRTERFTRYQSDPDEAGSLSGETVASIYEDRDGVIWVGTDAGLNRFDRTTDQFTHYSNDPQQQDSLVVCTDGITEAQNPGQDFFGEERLFHALQASGGAAAEDILKNVLTTVENFTQLAHQYDDIAVVVLQRDGC